MTTTFRQESSIGKNCQGTKGAKFPSCYNTWGSALCFTPLLHPPFPLLLPHQPFLGYAAQDYLTPSPKPLGIKIFQLQKGIRELAYQGSSIH